MVLTPTNIHHLPPFVHIVCSVHKLKQVPQLEKFNLKNRALKAHEKKLQQQLQQKKEMGKAEYEVENQSVRVHIQRG